MQIWFDQMKSRTSECFSIYPWLISDVFARVWWHFLRIDFSPEKHVNAGLQLVVWNQAWMSSHRDPLWQDWPWRQQCWCFHLSPAAANSFHTRRASQCDTSDVNSTFWMSKEQSSSSTATSIHCSICWMTLTFTGPSRFWEKEVYSSVLLVYFF